MVWLNNHRPDIIKPALKSLLTKRGNRNHWYVSQCVSSESGALRQAIQTRQIISIKLNWHRFVATVIIFAITRRHLS